MILPGRTLGLLGGGQLGQMFAQAARRMGYEVILLAPETDCPASAYASEHLCTDYLDAEALDHLGRHCDAVTTEFENVPSQALTQLSTRCQVRPGAQAVWIAQDRIREKSFLSRNGFSTAPFAVVRSKTELQSAIAQLGLPAILKVSQLGYDGKGQARVGTPDEAHSAWLKMGSKPCVLESLVELQTELSVVLARGEDGSMTCFPVAENLHRNGILDLSIVPARIDADLQQRALLIAQRIATQLEYIGVLTVEFFISGGQLMVNEIAPRPHNSGHYTIDACANSQFDLQLRALCGLPLGATGLLSPAVMVNLLGDLWPGGDQTPDWSPLVSDPRIKLHLYGKREARPGRKMGHFTCLATDVEQALAIALAARTKLGLAPDNAILRSA
jgi:5-(carboxyamino)imidazole ribonucleotide synthase